MNTIWVVINGEWEPLYVMDEKCQHFLPLHEEQEADAAVPVRDFTPELSDFQRMYAHRNNRWL